MIRLKTNNNKLNEIALALNKNQLFSEDNTAYIYRVVFRPDTINDLNFIRFDSIDLLEVSNTKINDDIKYKTALNTSYTSGGTFISRKESTIDHNGYQYMYAFINISNKLFSISKRCVEEDCNEYNNSHIDIQYDFDKSIFVINAKKNMHIVSGQGKCIDETITLTEEDNSFVFDPTIYYTLFVVFDNNFNIDTVKVFNREINLEECFYDLISDFDTGRDDIVFSTVGKKVDMKRVESEVISNKNICIRSNRDLAYEKYKDLENFMEIDKIEFLDGTYLLKDTEDDIRIDDPDYYFPMIMYGNTIGRYTQGYLNPGNDNYYNDSNIKRILLDTPVGDKVSKNIIKISDIISDTCYHVILHDIGGYLGVTLANDDGYDKHYLEVIKDAYGEFYMSVLPDVSGYINKLFSYTDSIRYYEDTFESDCEDTKVYDFSNLNNINHKAISIKKLVYTDKIFMNEDESAGIDILNLIIEYNSNGNTYIYNIIAMYSNANNAIMNININCTVNKKDSFAINLNQIDKCNLLCYSYIDNSNEIAEEVPISARLLKYAAESGLSRLSKIFIYDIYPSGDSYSDIFDKIDYPVYSAFSAGIRIK